jgi:hypothetical protein
LFLNSTLGDPLLPLTIENQDFANAISAADNCGKLLLEKWFVLDEKSQPSCYRLKSVKVEKESTASIDEELNSLMLTLVEVFSKEVRDSYLTTVVEQEINNTVLMSQELAKRCIWIQNSGVAVKGDDNKSLVDAEMNRRLSNIHSDLKVQILMINDCLLINQSYINADSISGEAHHQNACCIGATARAIFIDIRGGIDGRI